MSLLTQILSISSGFIEFIITNLFNGSFFKLIMVRRELQEHLLVSQRWDTQKVM